MGTIKITKELIEKQLGYEIIDFAVTLIYAEGRLIDFEVHAQPKEKLEYVDLNITILKTGEMIDGDGGFIQ